MIDQGIIVLRFPLNLSFLIYLIIDDIDEDGGVLGF